MAVASIDRKSSTFGPIEAIAIGNPALDIYHIPWIAPINLPVRPPIPPSAFPAAPKAFPADDVTLESPSDAFDAAVLAVC